MRIIAAVIFYFLIVFGVGFLLGPVRVFWLEPKLGETAAVLCEAPFLLMAICVAARRLPCVLGVATDWKPLAAMGLGALLLQQLADFAVGSLLRGLTASQQIAHLARPAGLIYVALLIIFAAMPALANLPQWRRRDTQSTPRLPDTDPQ